MKKVLFPLVLLLFYGCEENSAIFNIYKELELSKEIVEKDYKGFLKGLQVGGVSYEDDKLTPDSAVVFKEQNLTRLEKLAKYFIYSKNESFDHRNTLYIYLEPIFFLSKKSYIDEHARIVQIQSSKPIEKPKPKLVAKKVIKKAPLPAELLPPMLPDLNIDVDTPQLPEI
jgi:hypothetical protein